MFVILVMGSVLCLGGRGQHGVNYLSTMPHPGSIRRHLMHPNCTLSTLLVCHQPCMAGTCTITENVNAAAEGDEVTCLSKVDEPHPMEQSKAMSTEPKSLPAHKQTPDLVNIAARADTRGDET
jgi:hypothetical protein